MSNPTDNAKVTALPTESTESTVEEKLSFVKKSKRFVKNHKKATIAVVALGGLVGVAALTGRKTAPSAMPEELTPEEEAEIDAFLAAEAQNATQAD